MTKELPEGWRLTELGKVCHVIMGQSPPSDTYNNDGAGLPFFQGKAEFTELHPIVKKWCSDPNKIAEANDILLSVRAPVGTTNIANQMCCIGRGLAAIRYPNYKYIFYFLRLIEKELDKKGTGTTFRAISGETVRTLLTPIPPPDEEAKIVEKIEELFSELDKGIENLKTAQQQLKVYRQAVLKWAFVNDKFKGYIARDITEKIQIGPFGTQLHKEDYIENGIPLINPTHIKDGLIVADKSFTILESKRESLPNYILKEGDVIMGRRGEMARCGLVSKKEAGWFCGTGSLYFRPNLKLVDPIFLYYNLRSEPVKKYLDENAGGTTMANLNLKIVNNIPISIPSIQEQKAIVLEIESRLSVCDKMEETITTSLQQAEALRQSILKRAFEGKLVKETVNRN
jgi:type I restriction enzyme S subunit